MLDVCQYAFLCINVTSNIHEYSTLSCARYFLVRGEKRPRATENRRGVRHFETSIYMSVKMQKT